MDVVIVVVDCGRSWIVVVVVVDVAIVVVSGVVTVVDLVVVVVDTKMNLCNTN